LAFLEDDVRRAAIHATAPFPCALGLVVLVLLVSTHPIDIAEGQGLAGRFTADQRRALREGRTVTILRPLENWPWREVTVAKSVAATPLEVAAVHADFDSHASWSPGIVASRIVRDLPPGELHVSFEYRVFGAPNERYTLAITFHRAPGGYRTSWNLIESRYARRINGDLLVEPLNGGTLVATINRVDPGAFGWLGSESSMVERSELTVSALAARAEQWRAKRPQELADLVRLFSARLPP
jgi:polyketide cyclase/dehydrase/lipid transport protein